MLIILLIFALIRTLRGMPLTSPLEDPNGSPNLNLCDVSSHFGKRAVSDIILSCFATIFACTWSTVHPNIPAMTDCAWTRFKRQVLTMVYALLAPEAITAWALRQRLAARKIVEGYNEKPWVVKLKDNGTETSNSNFIINTMRATFHDSTLPPRLKAGKGPHWTLAHGFFLQMGGFMLSDSGRPIQTIGYLQFHNDERDMEWNIRKNNIDPPPTTEEDIQDRSKGDAISKTLVILQTMWFIVQCTTRWSNRLPVTELEVVTLGFAVLNGITYALWWHKPQNVSRPVFLVIKRSTAENSNPRLMTEPQDSETPTPESSGMSNLSGTLQTPDEEEAALASKMPPPSKESYIGHKLREDIKRHASSDPWRLLYLIPFHLVEGLLYPLAKLSDYDWRHVESYDLRVPMFDSEFADSHQVFGLTTLISELFGLVHLIPSWFLDFASVQEMWLWRVSAIIITVGPVFLGLYQYSYVNWTSFWDGIFKTILIGVLPLYIISRIILLTLALTSLRTLPPAALQTVNWTAFIPHI